MLERVVLVVDFETVLSRHAGTMAGRIVRVGHPPTIRVVDPRHAFGGIIGHAGQIVSLENRRDIPMDVIGILEQALLGGKNADTEETRVVSGIGGGNKKARFAITGDDPLYVAIAVAFAFFAWASSGGISLH